MPNDVTGGRARGQRNGPKRGCARRAPDGGSVEASGLRRATAAIAAVQPKRGDSPREMAAPYWPASSNGRRYPGGIPARHHGADHGPPLRVAVLAPIAWRTPPRHYGPWEQFASLLTEGLVAAGHDVTLFATADSITTAELHSTATGGWSDDAAIEPKVAECLHIASVFERADRVRPHPQRVRLPPAHLQRPRRHAGRDDDPRVLLTSDPSRLRALRRHHALRRDQRRRPAPGAPLRRHDPPRHRHGCVRGASHARRPPAVLRPHPSRQGHGDGDRGGPSNRPAARHRRHHPGRGVLPQSGRAAHRR